MIILSIVGIVVLLVVMAILIPLPKDDTDEDEDDRVLRAGYISGVTEDDEELEDDYYDELEELYEADNELSM